MNLVVPLAGEGWNHKHDNKQYQGQGQGAQVAVVPVNPLGWQVPQTWPTSWVEDGEVALQCPQGNTRASKFVVGPLPGGRMACLRRCKW